MTYSEDLVLTPADARRAGYCVDGVRRWFSDKNLDFRAFCKGQLTAADIYAVVGEDALLLRVIEAANERQGNL